LTSALYPTYPRADLAFKHGEGAWLTAENGDRYLDFSAGVAVLSLGHNHPHLVETLKRAAEEPWHVSNLFRIPQAERLAERLRDATFADLVFFTNSGAEAVECAIKTARKFHAVNGQPERYRLITFEGAFHGRTLATIAAGGNAKYLEGFGPPVEGFDQVPFGDFDAVEAAITLNGGVLLEPFRRRRATSSPSFRCARLRRARLLLVFDEVQWASPHRRSSPVLCWRRARYHGRAKGLGGGFPVGACLATKEAAQGMTAGSHGSTFGGNPWPWRGGAVLDVAAEGFMARRAAGAVAPAAGGVEDAIRRHRRNPRRRADVRHQDADRTSPLPPAPKGC
jgi:acetylornithine/N-succinyldiaminopimelate aminotransferase